MKKGDKVLILENALDNGVNKDYIGKIATIIYVFNDEDCYIAELDNKQQCALSKDDCKLNEVEE